ncbi:hypothetical protein PENSPDRAFT_653887 [Peniophora sp. CONT]|nr:hypothetical protein PENSPDRAFT_653887 [Peniophora sp. CONT]
MILDLGGDPDGAENPNGAEKYRASGLICALPTPPAYRFGYNRAFKAFSRLNQSCRVFDFAPRPGSRSPTPFTVHPWCGKISHFTTPRSSGAEKYRASRPHLCTMVRKRIEDRSGLSGVLCCLVSDRHPLFTRCY